MPFTLAKLIIEMAADDSPLIMSMRGIHNLAVFTGGAVGDALKLGFRTATGAVNALEAAAHKVGNAISAVGTGAAMAGIAGLTYEMYQGVKGAIQLQDVMSATTHVLGDASARVFDFADRMAVGFGVVKQEAIDASLQFSLAFKEVTKTSEDASIVGTQLAELGVNLRSFHGGSTQQAFRALESAVRGQFRPLMQYGILLNESMVKDEAVRMGLAAKGQTLDEVTKKQATYSLIMERSKDMQGDISRTANEANNQWQRLTGSLTNLATSIGTSLLPALTSVMSLGGDAVQGLSAAFEANKSIFEGWGATVIGWVDTIRAVWQNLPGVWEIVQIKFREMFENMIAALAVMPENAKTIGEWFQNNWVKLMKDAVNAVMTIFANLGENIRRLGQAIKEWYQNPTGGFNFEAKGLLEGFTPETGALPTLKQPAYVSLQSEIDKVTDKMAQGMVKAMEDAQWGATIEEAAGLGAGKEEPEWKKRTAEDKWKSQTFDSADFWSKLQEQALGGEQTPQQQLAEQKKIAENTKGILDRFDTMKARLA